MVGATDERSVPPTEGVDASASVGAVGAVECTTSVDTGAVGLDWSSEPVGGDVELSLGDAVAVVWSIGALGDDDVEVSVVGAGAVDWSTEGAGEDVEVPLSVGVDVGVAVSTVLPDVESGAVGAVGVVGSVGVGVAATVVCAVLVTVSVVLAAVSLRVPPIVPPRLLLTISF